MRRKCRPGGHEAAGFFAKGVQGLVAGNAIIPQPAVNPPECAYALRAPHSQDGSPVTAFLASRTNGPDALARNPLRISTVTWSISTAPCDSGVLRRPCSEESTIMRPPSRSTLRQRSWSISPRRNPAVSARRMARKPSGSSSASSCRACRSKAPASMRETYRMDSLGKNSTPANGSGCGSRSDPRNLTTFGANKLLACGMMLLHEVLADLAFAPSPPRGTRRQDATPAKLRGCDRERSLLDGLPRSPLLPARRPFANDVAGYPPKMSDVTCETRRTHGHDTSRRTKVFSDSRDPFGLRALCPVLGKRFLHAKRKEVPVDTRRPASGCLFVGGVQPEGKPTPLELQLHRVMGRLDALGIDGPI